MGLAIETIRQYFPRTAKALCQHHQMIERAALSDIDRTKLKTSANMLVIIAAEEASAIKERLGALAKAAGPVVDLLKALKR